MVLTLARIALQNACDINQFYLKVFLVKMIGNIIGFPTSEMWREGKNAFCQYCKW